MFYQFSIIIVALFLLVSSNAGGQIEVKGVYVELPYEERVEMGKLILSSSPPLAKVYINGSYKGVTPLECNVLPGSYEIRMTKRGYGSVVKSLYVEPGKAIDKKFNLPSRLTAFGISIFLILSGIVALSIIATT